MWFGLIFFSLVDFSRFGQIQTKMDATCELYSTTNYKLPTIKYVKGYIVELD